MRFRAKAKNYQLVVRAKTSFGEKINQNELQIFAELALRGFLKPQLMKKNQVEYIGPVGISLQERLKRPVKKREFLFILEHIVVAIQKLRVNNMSLNHLVLDIQYVFINEITKEVQFIYIPQHECKVQNSISDFIETIVYSVKPIDENDNDFVSKFIYFFQAMSPFQIEKIETFVMKEDKSVVHTIRKQNIGQSGLMINQTMNFYEDDNLDMKKNSANTLVGVSEMDSEATGLLNEECEMRTSWEADDEETGLLQE